MKHKAVIGVFICVLVLSFSLGAAGAFSLVNGSSASAAGKDKLAGVFITTEYLNTFDTEAYLNDNINRILSGKKINRDDTSKYSNRLYATIVNLDDKESVNEGNKKISNTNEFVFEGIEGILYYVIYYTDEKGNNISRCGGDEAITDSHINVNASDNGESVSMAGTIYTSLNSGSKIFYINPVYQTQSGELYALAGNGISGSGDIYEGIKYSTKLEEETTATINGKSSSFSSCIEVTISCMFPPEKIIITQMSDDNKVLSHEEYIPGSLPNEIKAKAGTSYIIVETCKKAADGSITTERELYQSDDESIYAFYCREDGICVKQSSQIKWR